MTELDGAWLAHPAEGDLHQQFFEESLDVSAWVEAPVPGHWRDAPGLDAHDGPVLYRHRFSAPPPADGRRRFLVLDGVFYYADTWLDEGYLGASEGYFLPHVFDVTEQTRARDDHLLAVEVACPPQSDRSAKHLVTGVFSHWDCFDERWNPGGIWRPVRLVETGPVRIERMRTVCVEATEERGRLAVNLTLDAAPRPDGEPRPVSLTARLTGPGVDVALDRAEQLAAGSNQMEWRIDVDRPPLWWPHRLGEQPLCDLVITVADEAGVSDTRSVRVGFREVRLDSWVLHVNGERLYVMGSNHAPARMDLGAATPDELRRDVGLAVEANLDMLRVHAHVTRPEFYEAADEAGLLLWQDFPLQWGYSRGIRKQAVRQARGMVDLLGHHPSVVVWCGHNEPLTVEIPTGEPPGPRVVAKVGASMLAPTWNKTVLDRSIRRAIRGADGSRPTITHSGILPGPASGGTDSHLYFGWYFGHLADLAPALKAWPRLARFVSEFGAQAVPDDAEFMDPGAFPALDWDLLRERHACQKHYFDAHVRPEEYPDFEAWRDATQAYQAALLQLQIEDLRRLKYRPNGGFLQFCFADALPAVTWSVLDHERRPKRGYAAMRDACRPVLPTVDPRTGAVHVVSERRERIVGAEIEAVAGDRRRRWSGDIEADGVTYVGTLDGPVTEHQACVVLRHPSLEGGEVENEYGPYLLHKVQERLKG